MDDAEKRIAILIDADNAPASNAVVVKRVRSDADHRGSFAGVLLAARDPSVLRNLYRSRSLGCRGMTEDC